MTGKNLLHAAAALCLVLPTWARQADAAILLNFGATVSDDDNSPAHAAGRVTGTTWNLITGDVSSGISDDMGGATTLSVDVGRESTGGTMDWTLSGMTFAGLGGSFKTGIYAGNARSAMYYSSNGVGVRVAGLEPGEYDIFHAGRNTNSPNNESQRSIVFAVDSTSGASSYLTTSGVVMHGTSLSSEWLEATAENEWQGNYLATRVFVDEGQDLVLVNRGPGGRGFLGIVEIVAVPEPASLSLVGLAGMALGGRRRR